MVDAVKIIKVGELSKKEGIPLTPRQIERQLNKIKKIIFTEYAEEGDGSYQGDIHPEILEIIEKYMVADNIEYIQYIMIIQECAKEIYKWIYAKIVGVDERLLTLYTYDFVTQSMDAIYIIKDEKKKDDPMFI